MYTECPLYFIAGNLLYDKSTFRESAQPFKKYLVKISVSGFDLTMSLQHLAALLELSSDKAGSHTSGRECTWYCGRLGCCYLRTHAQLG